MVSIRFRMRAIVVVVTATVLLAVQPSPPRASAAIGDISTIAGNGGAVVFDDGVPALEQGLQEITALAVAPDGRVYFAEEESQRIRRIEHDGTVTTVVGHGEWGTSEDGTPARLASLSTVLDLAFDAEGRLLFSDLLAFAVRRVEHDGTLSTVVGGGTRDPGSGGAAEEVHLLPYGLAVDGETLLVSDLVSDRVLRVSDGVVSVVAGSGEEGFSGDGGQAAEAQLHSPTGLAVGANGAVYIADYGNARVRRVWQGLISTVAGGGTASGDDGRATDVLLSGPLAVALDAAGNVFLSEATSFRIRKVDRLGMISRVAGTGEMGHDGDGGQATQARIDWTPALDVRGEDVLLGGAIFGRIRRVEGVASSDELVGVLPPVPPLTTPIDGTSRHRS